MTSGSQSPRLPRSRMLWPSEISFFRTTASAQPCSRAEQFVPVMIGEIIRREAGVDRRLRKLIAFDDDTFDKLKQLGRDRMATVQELADEAFADLLKKHGIPIDLKDALERVPRSRRPRSRRKRNPRAGETPRGSHHDQTRIRLKKANAPRAKAFRPKPIPIRTAVSSMRCGPPDTRGSPAPLKRTNPKAGDGDRRVSRSSSGRS